MLVFAIASGMLKDMHEVVTDGPGAPPRLLLPAVRVEVPKAKERAPS